MAFIDKTAMLSYIKEDNLVKITEGEDTFLDDPIADAESVIRDYFSHRYDVDAIYADPTNSKYRTLRKCGIDLAIYNLYCGKANPRHIPDLRLIAYQEAMKTLDKLASGKIGNGFPILEEDDTKAFGKAATNYDEHIDQSW